MYLPSCTTWQVGQPTPEQFITREHPQEVRVTRTDGSTVDVLRPVIRVDSLAGTPARGDTTAAIVIALQDIRSVAVQRVPSGIGGRIMLVVLVAALMIALLASGLSKGFAGAAK